MTQSIPVSLLLRESARTPAMIARVKEVVNNFGMTVTSSGNASLCCRLTETAFQSLFGQLPSKLEEVVVSSIDGGRPAGFGALELPVPEELKELVESISVLPPATRFK